MSKPDLEALGRAVHDVNQIIKEYQGLMGFSLMVDRDTGELLDVIAHPFAGVPTPPAVPERPKEYAKIKRP
jgi:hypothetical protein